MSAAVTAGVELYRVTATGAPVPAFPDRPDPDPVHWHLTGDQISELVRAGMAYPSLAPDPVAHTGSGTLDEARSRELVRRTAIGDGPGIALHKLTGTDDGGWWVTAPECVAALAAWPTTAPPGLPWTLPPFLARAAAEHGFQVWREL
ncbi:hypothetical protein ACFWPH_28675 [Nocardia sp. NPDC058499]|uniref:hypothetical protein n=1 Tax=Nocardia sp. NPDC058499 TaxID=3346530 RepID=UPI0036603F9B